MFFGKFLSGWLLFLLTLTAAFLPFSTANSASGANELSRPSEMHGRDLVTGHDFTWTSQDPQRGPLVMVFLSSVCPCSNSHLGELTALAKDFPSATFVGVNANADEELVSAKSYFEKSGLTFPVLRDPGSKWANQLRALKTPHSFVFDTKGGLVYQGGVSDSSNFTPDARKYLREALDDITHDRPVREARTRVLGCTIEREN